MIPIIRFDWLLALRCEATWCQIKIVYMRYLIMRCTFLYLFPLYLTLSIFFHSCSIFLDVSFWIFSRLRLENEMLLTDANPLSWRQASESKRRISAGSGPPSHVKSYTGGIGGNGSGIKSANKLESVGVKPRRSVAHFEDTESFVISTEWTMGEFEFKDRNLL